MDILDLGVHLRSHQKTMVLVTVSTARSTYGVAEGREIVYFICLDFMEIFDSKLLKLLFAGA